MPYHVSLELTADQVHNLKRVALDDLKTVKELVTDLVVAHLDGRSGKTVAGGGSREKLPAKSKTKG